MNIRNNIAFFQAAEKKPAVKRKVTKRVTKSLEYEMITHLALQQFQQGNEINFDHLLSIPLNDRIPGLINEYGRKRIHQMLYMMVKQFNLSLALPRAKKLTETKMSIAACEFLLLAEEDHLALEDIIVFLERMKAGVYGPIKLMTSHYILIERFEKYRQARHEAYLKIKERQEAELKKIGPHIRTAEEPTHINALLEDAFIVDISNRRKSG
jgi:hypothetical protein